MRVVDVGVHPTGCDAMRVVNAHPRGRAAIGMAMHVVRIHPASREVVRVVVANPAGRKIVVVVSIHPACPTAHKVRVRPCRCGIAKIKRPAIPAEKRIWVVPTASPGYI